MWNKIRRLTVWFLAVLMLAGAVLTVGGCSSEGPAETRAETLETRTEAPEETRTEAPEEVQSEAPEETQTEAPEETRVEAPKETEAEAPEKTQVETSEETQAEVSADLPDEHGTFTTKEEVAAYLHAYGHLPDNYITKKEAEALGWNSKKGNLWDIAPDMSIGGSRFGNYEKKLPEKDGRKYYECDLNYDGGYRGAERLIYSNDGLIFYTGDHYETFEQLY